MKKLGVVCVVSVLAMILTLGVGALSFSDVSPDDWYYEDVKTSYDLGLIYGKSNQRFDPMGKVTLAETITFASRIWQRYTMDAIDSECYDCEWYEPYLNYAIKYGIVYKGEYKDFSANVQRKDMANIFSRLLKNITFKGINEINSIPDVSKNSSYYNSIKTLYEAGVVIGKDRHGNFKPDSYITRAEIAAIINRIMLENNRIKIDDETARYDNLKEVIESAKDKNSIITTFDVNDKYISELYTEVNNYGGQCAFYLVSLDGKKSVSYNIDGKFHAASTVKTPYCLYAFNEIEKGNGTLDEIKAYEKKHYCAKCGVIQYSPYGTRYTLESILFNVIHYSDNAGYYMIQDRFPISGYNKYLETIGCSRMKLPDSLKWGYVYPRELAKIWNEVYHYSKTSDYGEKFFDLFIDAEYNFIKEAFEEKYGKLDYEVAHKSGFNNNGVHDTAIVLSDTPYIVIICTKPNGNEQTFIKNIAITLNEIMLNS